MYAATERGKLHSSQPQNQTKIIVYSSSQHIKTPCFDRKRVRSWGGEGGGRNFGLRAEAFIHLSPFAYGGVEKYMRFFIIIIIFLIRTYAQTLL